MEVFASNSTCHFCRQVREDSIQRISGMYNIERVEIKDDETVTYDLSSAQNVSSSMCPPRSIFHIRRVLEIVAERFAMAVLR